MKLIKYIITAVLALFIMQVYQTAYAAPPKNKAIIILDASGSMHGKIEGKAKIDIARGVIDQLLKDWDRGTELGITAYGHRQRGKCDDIETVVPIGKVNRTKVMSVINRLNPKGRTPLSAAVRAAANELKYTENKATVILVSDGGESCNADPCKLATELEKSGIDFTVHVVGFDIKDNEKAKLTCLAKNTGGQFLQAKNAAQLNAAMKQTVKIVTKEKPVTKPVTTGETGLELRTLFVKGGDPIVSEVTYAFFEAKKDATGKRENFNLRPYDNRANSYYKNQISGKGPLKLHLPVGRYYISIGYDDAFVSEEVEVKQNQISDVTMVLNAGSLALDTSYSTGEDKIDNDVDYGIYKLKKDVEGKREKVWSTGYHPKATIKRVVPAGRYYVTANYGHASASAEVEVKANEMTHNTLILNAGVLKVNASYSKGGDIIDNKVDYEIYEAKKNVEGQRKRIWGTGYHPTPSIKRVLPEGKYYIRAGYQKVSADKELSIKAGELTEDTLVLPIK